MKLTFGDLLLAFGIREIEQLQDVFLWFGFINNMNSFWYCTNEMKLGNKPEADKDRSWNPSWTVTQCTKKGWLYSWIVKILKCIQKIVFLWNKIRRTVIFQGVLKWDKSEKRGAGNYADVSKWKVENEFEQNLLAHSGFSWLLLLCQLCQTAGKWQPESLEVQVVSQKQTYHEQDWAVNSSELQLCFLCQQCCVRPLGLCRMSQYCCGTNKQQKVSEHSVSLGKA